MDDYALNNQISYYSKIKCSNDKWKQFLTVCDEYFESKKLDDVYYIGAYKRDILDKSRKQLSYYQPVQNVCLYPLAIPPNQYAYGYSCVPPLNNDLIDNFISLPTPSNAEKEDKIIEFELTSFQDLITLLNKEPYDAQYNYNINLEALHKVKPELDKINNMIGLKEFKEELLNQLLYFSQDLHKGGEGDFMHTVLCGPPGTGKTEVAMLLGQMYSKLGLLSKNIFRKVCRNDLVAGYLGQTAIKTKKVIDETQGGCLFIDEAYSLANDYEGDSYSRECIDVLCEALSANKKDWMVIIAGYEDRLQSTFFKANQGLQSRFIWKFHLQDYNAKELVSIFIKKIKDNEWSHDLSEEYILSWMEQRKKDFIHYGRDMEQLLSYSKIAHGRRVYGKTQETVKQLNAQDINQGFEKFKQNSMHKVKAPPMGMYL